MRFAFVSVSAVHESEVPIYAHSKNRHGLRQGLSEHSRNVADDARLFAAPLGAGGIAHAIGLLHDVGKYNPAFQAYLLACETDTAPPRGPDHKAVGNLPLR